MVEGCGTNVDPLCKERGREALFGYTSSTLTRSSESVELAHLGLGSHRRTRGVRKIIPVGNHNCLMLSAGAVKLAESMDLFDFVCCVPFHENRHSISTTPIATVGGFVNN
jgi:hypothetical protein